MGFGFNYTWLSLHGQLTFSEVPIQFPEYPLTFPIRDWPRVVSANIKGIFLEDRTSCHLAFFVWSLNVWTRLISDLLRTTPPSSGSSTRGARSGSSTATRSRTTPRRSRGSTSGMWNNQLKCKDSWKKEGWPISRISPGNCLRFSACPPLAASVKFTHPRTLHDFYSITSIFLAIVVISSNGRTNWPNWGLAKSIEGNFRFIIILIFLFQLNWYSWDFHRQISQGWTDSDS